MSILSKIMPQDHSLKKMFRILYKKDRLKFILIIAASILTGFVQSMSVASFMPFMNLLLDLEIIYNNKYLYYFYSFFKFSSANQFVIAIGIGVALLILLGNSMAIFTSWFKNRFILFSSHNLSNRLLVNYMSKEYAFILDKNTSDLSKNILHDVFEVTNGFLNGIMDLIINIIMIIFVLALLLAVNIKATIIIITFFVLTYGALMVFSRSKLRATGEKVYLTNANKHKYVNEALGGFKIAKALGIEEFLINRVSIESKKNAKFKLFAKTLQEIPKYVMDAIIFSSLAGFIVFLIIRGSDIKTVIPTISVYTLAGYRIMPELAKTFGAYSGITHFKPIMNKLYEEIISTNEKPRQTVYEKNKFSFDSAIKLDDIHFSYKESDGIINGINLSILKGTVTGFAGSTGAGKTTLIDIILGLLEPQKGDLFIDDIKVDRSNVRSWHSMIGYVPQEIYLIDDTIRANIAFGLPESEIDDSRIEKSAQIAAIAEFIDHELPDRYLSKVGERGVRLSGGQRQRIGLARALYRNPQVLILDEATSALDGATESSVIHGIHNLSNVKTIIIIAHRLNTLKTCDTIFLLDQGQVVAEGNFQTLSNKSDYFKTLSQVEKN